MPPEDDPRMDEQPTQEEWEAAMGKPAATGSGEPTYVPATPESEGPAQEPQMSEPTHKLPESLPYQMMIGDLRRCLFTRGDSAWNGYIRDMTAELEQAGEYVNVAEAFSRVNAKAAKMMGILEFQKAMYVPATPAPSQPAAREWLERNYGDLNRLAWPQQVSQALLIELLETYARQQAAAKDAEWRAEKREKLEWMSSASKAMKEKETLLEANCKIQDDVASIVSTHRSDWSWDDVLNDVRTLKAAERERDSLRDECKRLYKCWQEAAALKVGKE